MTRYAKKVDASQADIVAALKAAGCTVIDMSWCGRGIPDLHVVCPRSHLHWLEVKNPRKPTSKAKDDRTDAELEWARKVPTSVVRTPIAALIAVGIEVIQ